MDCDPKSLLAAAACYRCIPHQVVRTTMISLLCQWANHNPTPPPLCDHPVVIDWLARIAADPLASRPADFQIAAVCQFCRDLDTYGIMSKMLVVNVIVNWSDPGLDSIETMSHALIYSPGNGNPKWVNFGFTGGELTDDGILGGGSAFGYWMDTGFDPNARWGESNGHAGLSIYQSEVPGFADDEEIEIGCDDAVDYYFFLSTYQRVSNCCLARCWSINSEIKPLETEAAMFYTANRTSTSDFRLYHANSITAFAQIGVSLFDDSGATVPGGPMYFMAEDSFALNPNMWTSKRISFAAIHEGLDSTEAENLFNAVQALRIALLGGWA